MNNNKVDDSNIFYDSNKVDDSNKVHIFKGKIICKCCKNNNIKPKLIINMNN